MTTLYQMLNELRVAAKGPARGELRARLRDLRGTTLDNGLKGGELVLYNGKPFWVIGSQGNKALLVSTDWAHRVKTFASKVQRKHVLWPKKLGSLGLGEALDALALLMEATPERDSDMRGLAVEFLRKLRARAKDGSLFIGAQAFRGNGSLHVSASKVDPRYSELVLVFLPTEWARTEIPGAVAGGAFTHN